MAIQNDGFIILLIALMVFGISKTEYAMYVWKTGFDSSVSGCNSTVFLEWDKQNSSCFTHNWKTEKVRKHLWATCKFQNRGVKTIFLSDVIPKLYKAWLYNNCKKASLIYQVLNEGHSEVDDLKIYALMSYSDDAVSEQYLVKYVVWYNDNCAIDSLERFDGVAINNEAYTKIKCGIGQIRRRYLDKLQILKNEAERQQNGILLTHFSIGWSWGYCGEQPRMFYWNGKKQIATYHMIDIFDSVDVQVAATEYPQISNRAIMAGYPYAITVKKPFYIEIYTGKLKTCRTTFFPQKCRLKHRSEKGMFGQFDQFQSWSVGKSNACIHSFRGVYSSGGHPYWPAHEEN